MISEPNKKKEEFTETGGEEKHLKLWRSKALAVRTAHGALWSLPESVMCALRVWREAHVAVMWGSHGREALAFLDHTLAWPLAGCPKAPPST